VRTLAATAPHLLLPPRQCSLPKLLQIVSIHAAAAKMIRHNLQQSKREQTKKQRTSVRRRWEPASADRGRVTTSSSGCKRQFVILALPRKYTNWIFNCAASLRRGIHGGVSEDSNRHGYLARKNLNITHIHKGSVLTTDIDLASSLARRLLVSLSYYHYLTHSEHDNQPLLVSLRCRNSRLVA
jgi:hypothetical protein